MRALRAGVGLALCLWASTANETEPRLLEQGQVRFEAPTAARAWLDLEVVLIDGSGWSVGELAPMLDSLGGIYAQCDLALMRVDWRLIRVDEDLMDFSTRTGLRLLGMIEVSRPAAFLVRDTRQRPAFDAEAIGRGNSRSRPQLQDTLWLTRALPHPAIGLAHELAHVLMNSGAHDTRVGNLMLPESAPENRTLDADQCQMMLANGLAHGLLRPAGDPSPTGQRDQSSSTSPQSLTRE